MSSATPARRCAPQIRAPKASVWRTRWRPTSHGRPARLRRSSSTSATWSTTSARPSTTTTSSTSRSAAYDRPIFAIPGNHDGVVLRPRGPTAARAPTLEAFLRNFCAAAPGPSPDAGAIARTTMTQPGVYFTLDAPFVSIIGLYSNVLEGTGRDLRPGRRLPGARTTSSSTCSRELTRLRRPRKALDRAVILGLHHPPASADATHGGTTGLADDIDRAFTPRASGPTRSSPGTPTSTSASRAASPAARSPTSSPAAAATMRAHRPPSTTARSRGCGTTTRCGGLTAATAPDRTVDCMTRTPHADVAFSAPGAWRPPTRHASSSPDHGRSRPTARKRAATPAGCRTDRRWRPGGSTAP